MFKPVVCFLTLLVNIAAAASAPGGTSLVHHYGMEHGLTNGIVTDIAQDADGFLWIATNDGLNRFDGHSFDTFSTTNSGLTANELSALAVSTATPGLMWVGTQRAGICSVDLATGAISAADIPGMCSPDIADITPARDGALWITNYHYGPLYYNPATGVGRPYDFQVVKGLPRHCWTTAEGRDGHLLVGHAGHGFSVVDTVLNTCRTYSYDPDGKGLPGNTVYSICVDHNGNAWLGTENGAAVYNPLTGVITPFVHNPADPASISPGRVKSICRGQGNELYFATSQGGVSTLNIHEYIVGGPEPARFGHINCDGAPLGTSGRSSAVVFSDSFDNLWVGNTRAGVDVIDHVAPVFRRIPMEPANAPARHYVPVWSIAPAANPGDVWVGGEDNVFLIRGSRSTQFPLKEVIPGGSTSVMAVMDCGDGTILAGTSEHGAFRLDYNSGRYTPLAGSPREVRTFVKSPDGHILAGTIEGIFEVKGNTMTPVKALNDNLEDAMVVALAYDRGGQLWAGTFAKGITVFRRDGTLRNTYQQSDGFISNAVNSLKCDSRGRMWVATRNGAVMFPSPVESSEYNAVDIPAGAGTTHVLGVEEDSLHNMWLTTSLGVVGLNGNTLEASVYTDTPEVPLNTLMENGIACGKNGEVYFASNDGLMVLDRSGLDNTAAIAPPVVVTGVTVYGNLSNGEGIRRVHPENGRVSLSHDNNSFTISFTVPDYAMATRTEFLYNLAGFDDVWSRPGRDNSVQFRNLSPGTYVFQVRSRITGGNWTSPAKLLTIRVAPPWYSTWWAVALYILLGSALIGFTFYYYKKRVDLRQRLDARLEKLRSESRLNDERLRFYTNITHELRTPLTLIMGPLEDMVSDPSLPSRFTYKLKMMRESSRTLLNLINGILEFRKTETSDRRLKVRSGNLGNLVREITLRFKELNQNESLEFIIDIDSDARQMYYDSEKLNIILNNLLSNAVKYTPAGYIKVSYHIVERNGLRFSVVSVEDTGIGISAAGLPHIFERYYREHGVRDTSGTGIGLSLVKNLVDLHQGTIEVESEPGRGTTFTVSLLTDNLYPDAIHADGAPAEKPAEGDVRATAEVPAARPKVLVVEDNDDIREYIAQTLGDEFIVATANNGLEGLHAVQREHPDIIISDIMMPEMDGIELCRAVKEDIITSHVPVILLTAKDTMLDKETGYESGADSYLTKPFSAKLLISRIHNILRTRRRIASHMLSLTTADAMAETQVPQQSGDSNTEVKETINPLDRQFMEKILSVINENIAVEDLGVNFIADRMCMSSSTLYRKIMANVGVSTNEYVRHIRLTRAVELLMQGNMTVTDIAFATGFASHSSFAKAFKKEFGMTATEYVASQRKKNPDN